MALQDNALITLQQLKDKLGITDTSQDDYLEFIINAISDDFEQYCDRVFREVTITDYELVGNDRSKIVLPQRPITSIDSVYLNGCLLEEKVDDEYGGYFRVNQTDADAGVVTRQAGWWAKTFVNNPLAQNRDYDKNNVNIKITYTGGYSTIPANLQMACLSECARQYDYEAGGYRNISSEKIQSVSQKFMDSDIDSSTGWTNKTMNTLNKYKTIVIV